MILERLLPLERFNSGALDLDHAATEAVEVGPARRLLIAIDLQDLTREHGLLAFLALIDHVADETRDFGVRHPAGYGIGGGDVCFVLLREQTLRAREAIG